MRRHVVRVQFQRPQMARLSLAECAQRNERVALARVRKGQLRVLCQDRLDVRQRLLGPLQALQHQRERVANRHVGRGQRDAALEQAGGLLELALLLEAGRQDIQQQRMLEALRQRLLGERGGLA